MQLLKRFAAQEASIDWDAVYATEMPRVYNYFRYLGLEDARAEDLTSITFEKAWRSRKGYRGELGAVSTWLFRIARNTALDFFRGRRAEMDLETVENQPNGFCLEDALVENEGVERLRLLLTNLPPRERELVALKYGAGLTNRAIARETGLSESNVGTILHRVIHALREQWETSK